MVLIILALNSFHVAMEYTKETIEVMTSFLMALIPLLLALIATSGGIIFVRFFSPCFTFFNEYERNFNSICGITIIIFCSHTKHS